MTSASHSNDPWLGSVLQEDIGRGDITSQLTVAPDQYAEGELRAKSPLILAGSDVAGRVFRLLDHHAQVDFQLPDGAPVDAGQVFGIVRGHARALLAGERLALNLLQHLSGIATMTRAYVEAVKDTPARILDTRKTLPGLRALEKAAVKAGGGLNHRIGLDDGVLIKDNHIKLAGGIEAAMKQALARCPLHMRIEIEVSTPEEARVALDAGADLLLLDNMSLEALRQTVSLVQGRARLEASGGIDLDQVAPVAATGVDFISVGRLTHSAPASDINLKFRPLK